MVEISLEPLPHCLDLECPIPWTPLQEAALCQDYPFQSTKAETLDEFVIRRYLETLWLPESIMPLQHFIRSVRRVSASASGPHPLHAALQPLLLSVRSTQEKYHAELPKILEDGGGAEELEETLMWYAWSKEKFNPDSGPGGVSVTDAEEEWKKAWMQRLERREVQLQILIYLQLLALPALSSTMRVRPSRISKERKSRSTRGPLTPARSLFPPTTSVESTVGSVSSTPAKSTTTSNVDDGLTLSDRLEYFMDRLSLWQLVASLNAAKSSQSTRFQQKGQRARDWMQTFCEDIVEPLFKNLLPAQCALLRTKVFPHSPFSDDSSDSTSPPPPDLRTVAEGKAKGKRPASPLRLTELQKPRVESSQSSSRRADSQEPGTVPDRYRSRSRSVSISVEEVRSRGASRGGVASSKSLFKGEFEMKRAAPKVPRLGKSATRIEGEQRSAFSRENSFVNPHPRTAFHIQEPMTLAADTPVKKRVKVEDNDPDVVTGSPDALLLTGKTSGKSYGQGDREIQGPEASKTLVLDTPVKKRSKH